MVTLKYIHWKSWLAFVLMSLLLVGCSFLNSTSRDVTDLISEEVENIEEKEEVDVKPDQDKIKNELVKFFNQYYNAPTNVLIDLNRYPIIPNDNYREVYESFKQASLERLENYMTAELEKNLKKNYFTTDIHFPRFLLINGNVVVNYNKVEDLEYNLISQEDINDGKDKAYTYLIHVKVKANTIPQERFYELFSFNPETNYYDLINPNIIIEDSEKDEILLECTYVAKIQDKNNKIKFYYLKEEGEKAVSEEDRRTIVNNSFAKPINYIDKPLSADSLLIREFVNKFFNMNKDDHLYYEYAFDANFDIFAQALTDLAIAEYLVPDENNYRNQYPKMIIPTKDDIINLNVNIQDIKVDVHSRTSRGGRVYIVNIPAVAELSDYSKEKVEYRYYFQVEEVEIDEETVTRITRIQYEYIKRPFPAFDLEISGSDISADNTQTDQNANENEGATTNNSEGTKGSENVPSNF